MRLVTLLSGGLDSVVATTMAAREHEIVRALTFDYGQHAAPREIAAAQQVAEILDIQHAVIALPWLGTRRGRGTDPHSRSAIAGRPAGRCCDRSSCLGAQPQRYLSQYRRCLLRSAGLRGDCLRLQCRRGRKFS